MQRSFRDNNSNLHSFSPTMPQQNCKCMARTAQANVAEASSPYSSPTLQRFSHDDPLQHRLQCHISDCIKCRCDSGYNMTFTSSPAANSASQTTELHECFKCDKGVPQHSRRFAQDDPASTKRHDFTNMEINSLRNRKRNSSNLSLFSSSNETSVDKTQNCECHCLDCCQYCHVCPLRCSRSTCSDPMEASTNLSSSSQLCSCIRKNLNLHHLSSSNSNNAITSVTNSQPVHRPYLFHQHRRRCNCSSWSFMLASFFQNYMSPLLSGWLIRPERRRSLISSSVSRWEKMTSILYTMVTVATFCISSFPLSDACSSRSTPKPRPPSPTLRPNITIQTYTCPPEYDAHYCLNGATCFTVKIGESILYNCECAEGYMGQRCEFKDLDGSYLPSKQRAMLEQAGLTSGAAIIVVIVVIVCFYLYVRSRRKFEISQRLTRDVPDGMEYIGYENERRPFSGYYYTQSRMHNPLSHQAFHSPTNDTTISSYFQPYEEKEKQQHPFPICVNNTPPNHHCEGEDFSPQCKPLVAPTNHQNTQEHCPHFK